MSHNSPSEGGLLSLCLSSSDDVDHVVVKGRVALSHGEC
jgi:hypothetical protein